MRDKHNSTRISLTMSGLSSVLWCFTRQFSAHGRQRLHHFSIGHAPYFIWHGKKHKCSAIKIRGTPCVMLDNNSKLTRHGTKTQWIEFKSYEITHLYLIPFARKIIRTPCFLLDSSYSTVSSHSLSQSNRNIMRKLQVTDDHETKLDDSDKPFDSSEIKYCTLPLLLEDTSFRIIFKDYHACNLPYYHLLCHRHKWQSIVPKNLYSNALIT